MFLQIPLCYTSRVRGPTIGQMIGFIQHILILIRAEKDYAMIKPLVQCLKKPMTIWCFQQYHCTSVTYLLLCL